MLRPEYDEFPNVIIYSSSDEWLCFRMLMALLMFPSACAVLQLRKVRATFGSQVRRSLVCIFLIDADFAQGSEKNITENITEVDR
jgi:hypothetical protein